jgi:hypothetical protein
MTLPNVPAIATITGLSAIQPLSRARFIKASSLL